MTTSPTLSVSLPAAPDDHTDASMPDALLAGDPVGVAALGRLTTDLARHADAALRRRTGPLPAGTPADLATELRARLAEHGVLPRRGRGIEAVRALIARYAAGAVHLAHPAAAAHLQPPALTVAVAADALAGAFNASVDTWDSGPSAVELERQVVAALADLAGYPAHAAGVFTSGGTASTLHALLLARNAACRRLGGVPGAPWPTRRRPVVCCAVTAHFSVRQACVVLGLGADAVRPVPVDDRYRMRPDALADTLAGLPPDAVPVAVVATAGSTDFGAIDPLADCADIARRHQTRLHVDAAYGGGALLSDRLCGLLAGLDAADSITLDLHKIGWQPAPASVLLVRRGVELADATGRGRVAYLDPDDDGAAGYDGLLTHSLATTRAADAVKVAATFLALGRDRLGRLLEDCHDLAGYAANRIAAAPRLELAAGATLTTVVFRYRTGDPADADRVNGALRRRLLRGGTALVGRCRPPGRGVHLKLTLLNPTAGTGDVDDLLAAVLAAGAAEETC